jgi:hypothetical protein
MTLDVHLGGSHDAIFAYPGVVYASATIDGGPGNDLLSIASAGTDEFIGGDGRDRVSYGYSDVGVTVTIDGQPNDGAPGEHDNVHTDVEAFDGGYGPDHLYGTDANDVIFGNSGDDVIVGVGGDDTLIGGGGADHLYGGPGQDQLDGAEGRPYQWHDTLDCGSGFDYTALDESDTHTACENGQYTLGPGTWWSSPFPPDTPPPAWMPPLSPIPAIASSGSVNPRAGVARLAVRCRSAKDACRGRLILQPAKRADKRRLGSARLRVARGRAKTVAVQLTAYGRQAVKRRHTLRAVAVVIPGGGGSARRTPVLLTVVR